MIDSGPFFFRQERPLEEYLYEVHISNAEEGPWQRKSGFQNLEEARIEAVHLIRDTDIHAVRIIHVVEYYKKSAAAPAR
jgi:hypothetical protein